MPFIDLAPLSFTKFVEDLHKVENHTHYLRVEYHGKNISYEIVAKETHFIGRLVQFVKRLFDSSYNFNNGFPSLIKILDTAIDASTDQASLKKAVMSLNHIVTYINSKRFFGQIDLSPLEKIAKKIKEMAQTSENPTTVEDTPRAGKQFVSLQSEPARRNAEEGDKLFLNGDVPSSPHSVPIESASVTPFTEADMQRALDLWINDHPLEGENRTEAAKRILECFQREDLSLNLDDLYLASLPSVIGRLPFLHFLDVSRNRLSHLPEEIGQLTSLKRLNLQQNAFKNLPEELGMLKALTDLDVSENFLTSLPTALGALESLEVLYLNNNELDSLPAFIGNLKSLEVLYLNNNKLGYLPKEITKLEFLKKLVLSDNQLENLPEGMEKLTALTELDLRSNNLTSLEEVVKVTSLTDLDVRENDLENLPEEIRHLKRLTNFYAGANRLHTLPEGIGELKALTYLNLSENQLKTLPRAMGDLKALRELDVSYNPLESIPTEISELPLLVITFLQN